MIRRGFYCFVWLFSMPALAAWETILSTSSICDQEEQVCLQSNIRFEPNSKVMDIRGRLYKTAGPGTLTFEFFGTTPLNEQVYHSTSVHIRGRYNESIAHKIGPPYSNRTSWSLSRIVFEPAH